ncbi:hypothetical protein PIB30_046965 [Stylosanthes scabra]|uniref:Uncharacterized protein n=1 Tax=Stylosanthes scabra TaxID=79078 RepID=A0ABU6SGH1_9FABA|nr:hypothetical protein [Stylosanthes scabra]
MDFHSNSPTPMGRCPSAVSATNSPAPRENWWLESCHTCYHFSYARRELVPHRLHLTHGTGDLAPTLSWRRRSGPPILPGAGELVADAADGISPLGAGELE